MVNSLTGQAAEEDIDILLAIIFREVVSVRSCEASAGIPMIPYYSRKTYHPKTSYSS
jgi:hypothetical protein